MIRTVSIFSLSVLLGTSAFTGDGRKDIEMRDKLIRQPTIFSQAEEHRAIRNSHNVEHRVFDSNATAPVKASKHR